ncbi:hypothetical protein AYK25_03015 [Thermoplasmatales archaeon SM1-50]|nr:MAG: hypothetical protein AYK25_03015 [Thermoplasmatales archaeon SM1-50]
MKVLVLGGGMMGRAIAYDLNRSSHFDQILIGDKNSQIRRLVTRFFKGTKIKVIPLDAERTHEVKKHLQKVDIAVSALPYQYNYRIAKLSIVSHTHLVDLGGNYIIVKNERRLFSKAKMNKVTIIPDSGLGPGLTSIITHDIVNHFDTIDFVKIRVGGLPRYPQPPLNYQIVFSPYGLINEYVDDAMVLDHGKIVFKKSMSELETLKFPEPFGILEAFLTSGGCSTLPITYQKTIKYLDYKTIRYPGHCDKIKAILEIGFADEKKIDCGGKMIVPRDVFASLLVTHVPTSGEDVVLLKVSSQGMKKGKRRSREYILIDHYDKKNNMTAMMRTTGYPASITVQMIENGTIKEHGVFCPEEIIPPKPFFEWLKKRDIILSIREKNVLP